MSENPKGIYIEGLDSEGKVITRETITYGSHGENVEGGPIHIGKEHDQEVIDDHINSDGVESVRYRHIT